MQYQPIVITCLLCMLAMYLAIVAHRRVAERISRHVRSADLMFDAAPEAMFVLDQQGHIRRFNVSASRLFGYSVEQAVGRHVSQLLSADSRDHEGQALRNAVHPLAMSSGGCCTVQSRCADGSCIETQLRTRCVEQDGQAWIVASVCDNLAHNSL